MLLADNLHSLFRRKLEHEDFLLKYAPISNELMECDLGFIFEVTDYLKKKIKHTNNKIITKQDLRNKTDWHNNEYKSFANQTSGSTGEPFAYLIWKDVYKSIERDCHYKFIADEFNIPSRAKVLYINNEFIDRYTDQLVKIYKTPNILISHGLGEQAEVHSAIVNRLYYNNYYKYYEDIIKYASDNNIDIIHCPSNIISSLAWNCKRLQWDRKICKLLSNTGSKLAKNDVDLLANNIDNWCDHMRCWDGGCTFFTCKYNTYHLLDNLSWSYSDEYKLISSDYFSLPSPFVNYWNGDYAEISNDYNRCKCGRMYRSFEIGRCRSKITPISETSHIRDQIINNGLLDGIKRIEVVGTFMRIFTEYSLPIYKRDEIAKLFHQTEVVFTVEKTLP